MAGGRSVPSGGTELKVAVNLDPERLAALRVLCSQIGFAIDNYLATLHKLGVAKSPHENETSDCG